jgi:hypothetical protein
LPCFGVKELAFGLRLRHLEEQLDAGLVPPGVEALVVKRVLVSNVVVGVEPLASHLLEKKAALDLLLREEETVAPSLGS